MTEPGLRESAERLITARRQSVRPDAYFWLALDALERALRAATPAPSGPALDVAALGKALVAEIPAVHRWLTVGWKETMDDEAAVLAARLAAQYDRLREGSAET